MAAIQDHSNFKIVVSPEYTNWWTFYFEFFYRGKPVFNPEIISAGAVKADDDGGYELLPMLEKAIQSKTDEGIFGWASWEDEVEVEIKAIMKNLDKREDGVFDFTVFVSKHAFDEGEINYGFQNAGIKLFVNREGLKKFYEDLKREMSGIAKKTIEELSQKKEKGYEGHIKFLKKYVG